MRLIMDATESASSNRFGGEEAGTDSRVQHLAAHDTTYCAASCRLHAKHDTPDELVGSTSRTTSPGPHRV